MDAYLKELFLELYKPYLCIQILVLILIVLIIIIMSTNNSHRNREIYRLNNKIEIQEQMIRELKEREIELKRDINYYIRNIKRE